jgi:hypothetical protein
LSGGNRPFQSPRSRPPAPEDELVLQHTASLHSAAAKAHEQLLKLPLEFPPDKWASARSAAWPELLQHASKQYDETMPTDSCVKGGWCGDDPHSSPLDGDGDIDNSFRRSHGASCLSTKFNGIYADSELENVEQFQSTAVPESSPAGQSDLVRVVKQVRSIIPSSIPPVKVVKATRQASVLNVLAHHGADAGSETFD